MKNQGSDLTNNDFPTVPDDYDLKVDSQVEKFLELKHKLTFFLITSAVGSIGYTLNFAISRINDLTHRTGRIVILSTATIFSLLTVALTLFSLYKDISSYRLHLKYRYLRKMWEQVSPNDKKLWDQANRLSKVFEKLSFVCLVLSVILQAVLFLLFIH